MTVELFYTAMNQNKFRIPLEVFGQGSSQHCCKWGWTLKLRRFASLCYSPGLTLIIWL